MGLGRKCSFLCSITIRNEIKVQKNIILMCNVSPHFIRKIVASYKGKYVHEVLVNGLVKLGQDKSVVR